MPGKNLTRDEATARAAVIAVDHYDQGELIAAVAELNAERVVRLRERQRKGEEAASG